MDCKPLTKWDAHPSMIPMPGMIASVTGLFSQFSLESGASASALKGTGGADGNVCGENPK